MTVPLEVEDLSVEYAGIDAVNRAVNAVSLRVGHGEVVGLVGESGSGKTTAALAVLGLTRHGGRIVQGSVTFEGQELLGLDERRWRQIRGDRIGLVTQNPRGALSPVQQVGEQIQAAYRAHRDVSGAQAHDRALELLRRVGINDPQRRMRAFPHELSGGMAQRVLIAMALACEPSLLLADEPTSGLDVTVQAQVLDDLRHAAAEAGSSVLLVTQDLGIVANYCDRVYLMHAGEVVEEAATRDFFLDAANPALLALLAAQRGLVLDQLKLRGFPIDGRRLPDGCWLHPRCPFAQGEAGCLREHPALAEIAPGHSVRCHRAALVRETGARLTRGTLEGEVRSAVLSAPSETEAS